MGGGWLPSFFRPRLPPWRGRAATRDDPRRPAPRHQPLHPGPGAGSCGCACTRACGACDRPERHPLDACRRSRGKRPGNDGAAILRQRHPAAVLQVEVSTRIVTGENPSQTERVQIRNRRNRHRRGTMTSWGWSYALLNDVQPQATAQVATPGLDMSAMDPATAQLALDGFVLVVGTDASVT